VVQQFAVLREEHEQAMLQFRQELVAAGPTADLAVLAEKHPGKKYFLRLVELAEKHPEHPLCSQIVGYALHCGGPHVTPEDQLRAKSILEQHQRLSKSGVSP
jgi:hypothetical protein